MFSSTDITRQWLNRRVRTICVVVFFVGSLLPPYIPKAALAPPETTMEQQQFLLVEDGFLMKSSSLTKEGARRAYTKGHLHVVKEGDTLESLAKRYEIATNTLLWANDLKSEDTIHPGDELVILPVDGVLHSVTKGQTLLRIADLYDVPIERIMKRNDLESAFILIGQQLIIPDGQPIITRNKVVATVEPPPGNIGEPPVKEPAPSEGTVTQEPVVITSDQEIPDVDVTFGVLQKPCSNECFFTQYYHGGHYAVDMQERGGGNIYAAEAGTITRADYGWNGGYGNVIEIDHGNDLKTVYGHNKKIYVSEGDTVQRGQKIADMGNTGLVYGRTGIHVHFEVRLRGVKKNPILYIQ